MKINLHKLTKLIFITIAVWIFVRVFLFQTFQIHTGSMHQTLVEGDYILVNKFAYGARIPITPLSLPFGNNNAYLDLIQLPYLRLPGYTNIKRNDVIVFNFPIYNDEPLDQTQEYVKRCVALPGDTLRISKGDVFINNTLLSSKENVGIHKVMPETYYRPEFFPNNGQVKWNPDNITELYIPKKNQSIILNNYAIMLYKTVIEKFEGNIISQKDDSVFVNKKYCKEYTFKMNYYFAMGDNRNNSIDSRFWGFVPENRIIGKAAAILFSKNKTSRLFSFIK